MADVDTFSHEDRPEVKALRAVRWQLQHAISYARLDHADMRRLADDLEIILGHVKRALGDGKPPGP